MFNGGEATLIAARFTAFVSAFVKFITSPFIIVEHVSF